MSKPTYTDGDLLIADQDKLRDWEDGECEGIDVLRPAKPEEWIAWGKEQLAKKHNVDAKMVSINYYIKPHGHCNWEITTEDLEAGDE